MLTPLRIGMSRRELEKRMKEIDKEDKEQLEQEKKANDEFIANAMVKTEKE